MGPEPKLMMTTFPLGFAKLYEQYNPIDSKLTSMFDCVALLQAIVNQAARGCMRHTIGSNFSAQTNL